MGVHTSRRCFKIPDDRRFSIYPFYAKCNFSIGKYMKFGILNDILLKVVWIAVKPGYFFKLVGREISSPLSGMNHLCVVGFQFHFREKRPHNQVYEVGRNIHDTSSLLFHIKKPCWTDERRPGYHFSKMVNAFLGYCRIVGAVFGNLTEDFLKL